MGGRGAYSASGRTGLPGGAVAFTFSDGRHSTTMYQNGDLIMVSNSVGSTVFGRPVKTDLPLSKLYENAKESGMRIQLHSPHEIDSANADVRKRKSENQQDIAYAELHPQAGRAGIHARRLRIPKA